MRTHSCRESGAPDKTGLLESGAGLSKAHLLLDSSASKTHLLDALFQGRKASQENLASQGGSSSPLKLGLRSHTKSESIDSGSSASSYSIASECATLPGDLTASSVEVLTKNANAAKTIKTDTTDQKFQALDSRAGSPGKAPSSSSSSGGRVKKFPSNRSFSVASLTPKLNKLPEMATNIRRRMSNQFAQAGHQVNCLRFIAIIGPRIFGVYVLVCGYI